MNSAAMKSRYHYFLVFSCAFIWNCTTSKNVTGEKHLYASALQPYGRFSYTKNGSLELIGSAVHFGFSFKGKQCNIFASIPTWLDHNYLQYEIDGVYQKRVRVTQDTLKPIVIPASSDGIHKVWIFKATEAATGAIFIRDITGNDLNVIPNSNAPLIEFIGNSITCGAAADASEVPCGGGPYYDQHNAYYAYGPRAARAVGMNYVLSSVSGIGIYRNWNSDGPTMPQVYEKLDLQMNNRPNWDFEKYHPSIVSIALGTNDFSNGDGKKPRLPFDSSLFVGNYIKFVQLVKSKYSSAQIVLLNSPMVGGERGQLLENCIAAVKSEVDKLYTNDKPVSIFLFKPMHARGCSGHPNVEDHAIMAEQLAPFLKKFL
jgi:hypothetical protein